jgi:hypothetical protein
LRPAPRVVATSAVAIVISSHGAAMQPARAPKSDAGDREKHAKHPDGEVSRGII